MAYMDGRPDKVTSRRIRLAIDEVLWNDWDPIGVNDDLSGRDEYTMYVGDIYELLLSNASVEKIAAHLDEIAEVRMEINRSRMHSIKVAEKLLAIPRYSED